MKLPTKTQTATKPPTTQAQTQTQPPEPGLGAGSSMATADPLAAAVVKAIGMTKTKEGWSVIQYTIQGREILTAELLGDDPAMSKMSADNLIRAETWRRIITAGE